MKNELIQLALLLAISLGGCGNNNNPSANTANSNCLFDNPIPMPATENLKSQTFDHVITDYPVTKEIALGSLSFSENLEVSIFEVMNEQKHTGFQGAAFRDLTTDVFYGFAQVYPEEFLLGQNIRTYGTLMSRITTDNQKTQTEIIYKDNLLYGLSITYPQPDKPWRSKTVCVRSMRIKNDDDYHNEN